MLAAVGRTLKVRNSSPAETGVRRRIKLGNDESTCNKRSLQCIRKGKGRMKMWKGDKVVVEMDFGVSLDAEGPSPATSKTPPLEDRRMRSKVEGDKPASVLRCMSAQSGGRLRVVVKRPFLACIELDRKPLAHSSIERANKLRACIIHCPS